MWAAMSRPIIPNPLGVYKNIAATFIPVILPHVIYSAYRVIIGIIISMVIGISLGIAMGYFEALDRVLMPVIYFIYPVPKIALLPVVMLLFGIGEASKIIMIVMIVVFQVVVAIRDSVKGIPEETYYSLYSLGAGNLAIFKKVVLPACLTELFTSVRISLGTALSVLFFTETFGTEYGMGYLIMDSWMRINYIDMYSGIVVLSFMGLGLFKAVDILQKRICPWNER
jgi:NitT/TauT family transport system permease protein